MFNKLKILYIEPDLAASSTKKKLFYNNFFSGQEGYFEEALFSAFDVRSVQLNDFLEKKLWKKKDFDVFVYNYKATGNDKLDKRDQIIIDTAGRIQNVLKILFIGSARTEDIPGDAVLDAFDIIFKREHFRDLSRYNISEKNKQKLRTTMLSCPLIVRPRTALGSLAKNFIEPPFPAHKDKKKYDISFSGALHQRHPLRLDVLKHLKNKGFNLFGGLQHTSDNAPVPKEFKFPKLSKKKYAQVIRDSRINLALEGIGEFTYRHLEIWYLGEFMISSPSIKNVITPLPFEENIHYVSYDSLDDLSDKVCYYLKNDSAREKIARAGKEMFDKYYNPHQYGEEIRKEINKIL